MPAFALCENLVENAGSEPDYLLNILYRFAQDFPATIALDKPIAGESRILMRYKSKVAARRDLRTWFKLVANKRSISIDYVPIPNKTYQGREIYVEVAAGIFGERKLLLAWTAQDYVGLAPEARGVHVLSRDEAKRELLGSANVKQIFGGVVVEGNVGDRYKVGLGVGVGPGAHGTVQELKAEDFMKGWQEVEGQGVDPQKLAGDLQKLVEALKEKASGPEQKAVVPLVEAAEKSARENDGPTVIAMLSKTGKWVFDVATAIGATVAAAVLRKALGLP